LQHLSYSESSQRMMHNNNKTRQQQQQQQKDDDSSHYYFIVQQLSAFISTGNNNRYQTTTDNNRIRPTTAAAAAAAAGNTGGGTVSRDVYRLIWDASASLADSRPPANLCIYDKYGSMIPSSSSSLDNNNNSNENNNDPPIFDGSVANATPLPAHGGGAGGGVGAPGGSGTILHLACAMDRPLMLVFLLIMGADGRANHTAFRRLMVHEAACNGSINCLTLLLEIGHKYATKDTERKSNNYNNIIKTSVDNNNNCAVPFLPDDMDISSSPTTMSLPPPRLAARPPPPITMNFGHFGGRVNNINTSMSIIGSEKNNKKNNNNDNPRYDADFLSVLQQFQNYTILVNEGKISELQAARSLLDNAPILETTQTALIRSCSFRNDSLYANHSFLRPFGCADGHGNTPLHWASFKNETECVALLLHYNADPNARAHPSGWSPLHDAAYSNSSACIELLCKKGAQIDAKANSGATPLCFAAQEDASEAAQLLLELGADLSARCAGPPQDDIAQQQYHFQLPNHPHSRFSGYTPLHYCAHYNAQRVSHVLLGHSKAKVAMEVPDLSGRLPIHVAVARGSSDVLRALLHAGARVDIRPNNGSPTVRSRTPPSAGAPIHFGFLPAAATTAARQLVVVPPLPEEPGTPNRSRSSSSASTSTSPVTSPVLRSMIPSQPISSSKPWNCLSQQAIDKCKDLILKSEQSWSPDHHLLFTPHDRKAIMELLRVGKRLEQNGTGIFLDLWPNILSFCGRGWFETEEMKLSYNDFENTGQSEGQRDIHRVESDDDDVTSTNMVGDNFLALPRLGN
jgi:ankyrin repeat protein